MDPVSVAKPHPKTILLVEDEDFVRNVTREVLELDGYRVLEAFDAENGLELYNQHAHEVDLLLTDVVMPGMNGKEFATRLAKGRPNLKVIFMSGYTDNEVVREGFSDPSLHYLQKPFTLDGLLEKVRELLFGGTGAPSAVMEPMIPKSTPIERLL